LLSVCVAFSGGAYQTGHGTPLLGSTHTRTYVFSPTPTTQT
jgi:hypothetical protein